jgi:pimeloyl-ACP methyl ester carboxylesterase
VPHFYAEGEYIKPVDGVVRGGVTVSLRHHGDFEFMRSVCSMAAQSSEPLHVMYGLLHSDIERLPIPNLDRHFGREETSDDRNEIAGAMDAAVTIAADVWQAQKGQCDVVVSVPRPDTPNPKLDLSHQRAALILHKGSVRSTLSLGSLRVAGFAVGLFCGRGIAPSQRAERILEDTRRKVLERPDVEPLERLDTLRRGALRDRTAVVIFLHGLLSTDVGLFDPLLRKMQDQPDFAGCAYIGWPHDTLAGIDANATRLRSLVDQVIGLDGPPVLFVAHSRGGLLARSAAVKLYDKSNAWVRKLSGCITFGTPHEGCPLAEAPGDLLGKVICIQALRNTGSWLSLADALAYTHQSRAFRGIEQLRPINGGGDFLRDLLDTEARYAPDGLERALDILAVGGRTHGEGMMRLFSERALATSEHDLIVETRSSIPPLFPNREVTDCDHFGYFNEEEMDKRHIAEILDYCRARLDFNRPVRPPADERRETRRIPQNWSASES